MVFTDQVPDPQLYPSSNQLKFVGISSNEENNFQIGEVGEIDG